MGSRSLACACTGRKPLHNGLKVVSHPQSGNLVPLDQMDGDETGQEEPGHCQGQPIPGRHVHLQEIGAPGAHLETPGLQGPGHGLAAPQGQEEDRRQQGQVAFQAVQGVALLPAQAPGLLGLFDPHGRVEDLGHPAQRQGKGKSPGIGQAHLHQPDKELFRRRGGQQGEAGHHHGGQFQEVGGAKGQGLPADAPEQQGGTVSQPGPDSEAEDRQGQQEPADGPQSPPGPGQGYVPQHHQGGQGHHLGALGQQHHDKAGQQQAQLGAGIEAADPVKARRGLGKFISLHRDLTFPKIRI